MLFRSKKWKEQTEYSKTQAKKNELRICKACQEEMKQGTPADTSSTHLLFKPLSGAEADKKDKMMCLSMHQPWASLLVYGIKRVEGRGWNTDFRGRLWIHAAAKEPTPELIASCEERYREIYRQHGDNVTIEFPKHYPTSALLGYVDVVDVVPNSVFTSLPLPETVLQEEEGSPYVFFCQNYHRILIPFTLCGDHKIWKLDPQDCKACKYIMKESVSPYPVDFYTILKDEIGRASCRERV